MYGVRLNTVAKCFESIVDKWEELEDEGDYGDEPEQEKRQSDYEDAKKIHKVILNASR